MLMLTIASLPVLSPEFYKIVTTEERVKKHPFFSVDSVEVICMTVDRFFGHQRYSGGTVLLRDFGLDRNKEASSHMSN